MKTAAPPAPIPSPATLVDCPWCETPIELERDAAALDCPACRVIVELAPTTGARIRTRPLAPAA